MVEKVVAGGGEKNQGTQGKRTPAARKEPELKAIRVFVPPRLAEALAKACKLNKRPQTAEVAAALEAHLKALGLKD